MKKLNLSKETLVSLSADQAGELGGGAPYTRYGANCSVDYCWTDNLSCYRVNTRCVYL